MAASEWRAGRLRVDRDGRGRGRGRGRQQLPFDWTHHQRPLSDLTAISQSRPILLKNSFVWREPSMLNCRSLVAQPTSVARRFEQRPIGAISIAVDPPGAQRTVDSSQAEPSLVKAGNSSFSTE